MLTSTQRLLYVPGIALILCGGTWLILELVATFSGASPKIADAQRFLLWVSPLMLALPAIPMLMLGGTMEVRIEASRLEIVRVRAVWRAPAVIVDLKRGTPSLHVEQFRGRLRGFGRLIATQGETQTVLVDQASLIALRRASDELETVLRST